MAQGLAGLILAGGLGERFGGPKAFARLPDGATFLERCAATMVAAGAAPVIATVPPETAVTAPAGVDLVPLPVAGLDMLASVRVGLGRLIDDPGWLAVAILPVDHPLVAAASVRALAAFTAPCTVPVYRGKRGHPVCLARSVAMAIVREELPGPTLREALRTAGRRDVAVDDPGVVANCNTPDRLRQALAVPA